MVDSVSVRFKNASVSKKNALKHSCTMREPLARRSASAKNAVACRGLRVGPSKEVKRVLAPLPRLPPLGILLILQECCAEGFA